MNNQVPTRALLVHSILLEKEGPGMIALEKVKKLIRAVGNVSSAPSVNAVLQHMDDQGWIEWDKSPGDPNKEVQVNLRPDGTDASDLLRAQLKSIFPGLDP